VCEHERGDQQEIKAGRTQSMRGNRRQDDQDQGQMMTMMMMMMIMMSGDQASNVCWLTASSLSSSALFSSLTCLTSSSLVAASACLSANDLASMSETAAGLTPPPARGWPGWWPGAGYRSALPRSAGMSCKVQTPRHPHNYTPRLEKNAPMLFLFSNNSVKESLVTSSFFTTPHAKNY